MHSNDIVFDVENSQIGIVKAQCSKFTSLESSLETPKSDSVSIGEESASASLSDVSSSIAESSSVGTSSLTVSVSDNNNFIAESSSIKTSSTAMAPPGESSASSFEIKLSGLRNPQWFIIIDPQKCDQSNYSTIISLLNALSLVSICSTAFLIVGALCYRERKKFLIFEYTPDLSGDQIGNLADSENVANQANE